MFGTTLGEIKTWSINPDVNTPDVTSMDSNSWAQKLSGIKSWNGSFESFACANLFGSVGIGSFYVGTAPTASTPVYAGTVIIKGPAVAVDVAGEVRYTYAFEGTGPIAITLSA
jgi:predicted secreted protein